MCSRDVQVYICVFVCSRDVQVYICVFVCSRDVLAEMCKCRFVCVCITDICPEILLSQQMIMSSPNPSPSPCPIPGR